MSPYLLYIQGQWVCARPAAAAPDVHHMEYGCCACWQGLQGRALQCHHSRPICLSAVLLPPVALQWMLLEGSAETVEEQDPNFRHAAVYSRTLTS